MLIQYLVVFVVFSALFVSQTELGEKVGLNADRIQKYENGARKPKADLLKKIAEALEVSTMALEDPVITSYVGAMFMLFELENSFHTKLKQSSEGHSFEMEFTEETGSPMCEYVKEWYEIYKQTQTELEIASSDEEREEIMKSYHNWKWNFPKCTEDENSRKEKKLRLKNKIEELKAIYEKL